MAFLTSSKSWNGVTRMSPSTVVSGQIWLSAFLKQLHWVGFMVEGVANLYSSSLAPPGKSCCKAVNVNNHGLG